jgi:uncharacterized ParB-like nuclease family protein
MVERLKPKKLSIDALSLDSKTQQRFSTKTEAVEEYADAIRRGLTLPPITVFFDADKNAYYIADGWHRVFAYKDAGVKSIMAIIKDGTLEDAIFAACGANTDHGVRRTNNDKKRAVTTILKHPSWSKMSDRSIGDHCGVSHSTVSKYRTEVANLATNSTQAGGEEDEEESSEDIADQEVEESEVEIDAEEDATDFDPENLPAGKIDIDALAQPFEGWINSLNRMKRELVAQAEDPRNGAHLHDKITRITTEIDEIKSTLKSMTPAAVCEGCEGDGCKKCANSGFWTKAIVESKKR